MTGYYKWHLIWRTPFVNLISASQNFISMSHSYLSYSISYLLYIVFHFKIALSIKNTCNVHVLYIIIFSNTFNLYSFLMHRPLERVCYIGPKFDFFFFFLNLEKNVWSNFLRGETYFLQRWPDTFFGAKTFCQLTFSLLPFVNQERPNSVDGSTKCTITIGQLYLNSK
jgi:hypothetical protein